MTVKKHPKEGCFFRWYCSGKSLRKVSCKAVNDFDGKSRNVFYVKMLIFYKISGILNIIAGVFSTCQNSRANFCIVCKAFCGNSVCKRTYLW